MAKRKNTKTLLVDGNSLIKRSHFGANNLYTNGKKTPEKIGALFQFYTTLRKLIIELSVDKVVIMWDGNRGSYMRLKNYSSYKNNDTKPKYFDIDLERQKIRVMMYAEELSIRQCVDDECEADDLIAYYTLNKKKNEDVIIYTSDHDLFQLINKDVSLYLPSKKSLVGIGNYKWFFKHHYKNAYTVKVFDGCTSDNIKGIDLVSEKTLINTFPEITNRYVSVGEIVERSKSLLEESDKKPKFLKNIVEGKTKGNYNGDFYEEIEKLVSLKKPQINESGKEIVEEVLNLPINPSGRSYKNVLDMMIKDGFIDCIYGGSDGYVGYLEPFVKIIKKETLKYKKEKTKFRSKK